jgi:hypothetical protein
VDFSSSELRIGSDGDIKIKSIPISKIRLLRERELNILQRGLDINLDEPTH